MTLQTFIYSIPRRLAQCRSWAVSKASLAHQFSKENSVYKRIGYDLAEISVNGLAVWLVLIPLSQMKLAILPAWWTIPMLGILPWYVVLFIHRIRKKSDR